MSRLSRLELVITTVGAAFAVVAYPLHSDLVSYPAALLAVAGLSLLLARLFSGPDR